MFGFSAYSEAPFSALGSVSAEVNVTGVAATGQLGTAAVYAEAIVSPSGCLYWICWENWP